MSRMLVLVLALLACLTPILGKYRIEIHRTKTGTPLRIMTFNTWIFGANVKDGLYKLAKHIRLLQPDIVALQEVQTHEGFQSLLDKLGPEWQGVTSPSQQCNVGIVSRHTVDNTSTVVTKSNTAIGVNIHLQDLNETISFWSLHLAYTSYGPYAANNKQVTSLSQILKGEAPAAKNGRQDNILELLKTREFIEAVYNCDDIPLIVCGDFNTPSHMDWINETRHLHGDWVVQWPATYLLQSKTGLLDSYREIFPDPSKDPGNTWSTVNLAPAEWDYSIPEPMDRIDFIMFKSAKLNPKNSFMYSGHEAIKPMPNHWYNDYPSDHYAVITDFTIKHALI